MTDLRDLNFYNPTKGRLDFNKVIEEVFSYMKQGEKNTYEIVVGCDSSSEEQPVFPLALVVLRKGFGGRFFLAKVAYQPGERRFYSFRERILEEVYLSCDLALKFKEALKEKIQGAPLSWQFEHIHADVGPSGQTRDMIKEVVGLIKANGFEAKIKPESFAASIVADRFT